MSASDNTAPVASSSSLNPSSAIQTNDLLFYYKSPEPARPESPPAPPPVKELSKTRLYVGNLHPTVDEYTLLQIFTKYGKISKLDFLFHKSGPNKGKPRGFAFIEYSVKEDAMNALVKAHDKLIRGRKLVVTFANQAPEVEHYYTSGGPGGRHGRRFEQQRPTTLSLLKSGSASSKTEDKIAALEAKLRQMQKEDTSKASTLPTHSSLPLKPAVPRSEPPVSQPSSAVSASTLRASSSGSNSRHKPTTTTSKPVGIFASGSNALGKKPTVDELLRTRKVATAAQARGIFGAKH